MVGKECETKVKVDTTEPEAALRQLEQHAEITARSVVETVNKGYQTMTFLGDIMGIALPEWFNLMASAALMAGEMFATLAAAETMTGLLAAKAVVTFSIATMMFYRAMVIQMQRTEVENKLHSTLMLLQLYS